MDLNRTILSQVVTHNKYARYLKEEFRRETWDELVERNLQMHLKRFPHLEQEIRHAYTFVFAKKVLPSMRSLQFGGRAIEVNPTRGYNCSFDRVDDYRAFSEAMFLLLGGTGYGYSVQTHHVEKLPPIKVPGRNRRFLIADSIEGWADAVKALMKAYLFGASMPVFDFSEIRPKGAPLVTAGGKAPGPEPLKECLFQIQKILDRKHPGEQLRPIECHDIMCHIADAVKSGGIRRAAMIALFSLDDEEMLTCKFGTWYEDNPQRGRANNSAVVVRNRISKREFFQLWAKIRASGSGEPGLSFTNDPEYGFNPCHEASLRANTFCNLCELNASLIRTQEEFNECARVAAFIGTLQASYTDFHYLREVWKRNTEKDALIGVGITGIADEEFLKLNFREASEAVVEENRRVAALIGINTAARCCVVKPSGTTSLVLGTSSGIHAWFNDYYIRRMKLGKNEAIYQYLMGVCPELIEDDYFKPQTEAILSIPIKAPDGAILRTEPALQLLERVKLVYQEWILPGWQRGPNPHNVSCTVSIKEEEWDEVGEWMWENREYYSGISVLPYDGGSYVQAPFEDCDEDTYNRLSGFLKQIHMEEVIEFVDSTDLSGEAACGGGGCEVPKEWLEAAQEAAKEN